MRRTVLFCSLSLAPFVWAAPIGPCPAVLNFNTGLTSNGCSSIITINSNGGIVVVSTGQPPFDNDNDGPSDPFTLRGDFLVGVINHSTSAVSMLSLTGANGFFTDFDENIGVVRGVLTQLEIADIAVVPGAFNINERNGVTVTRTGSTSGTVAFNPSIAPGSSTYFAVEGLPDVPEPSLLPCVGIAFGILFAWHRRAANSKQLKR